MTVSSGAIGPKQAGELVGRSKAAIIKAIREGRISGEKNGNGEWRIEPAELFRVYEPANTDTATDSAPVNNGTQDGLQREIELLRAMVDDLRADRDEWRKQAQQLAITDQRKGIWARLLGR